MVGWYVGFAAVIVAFMVSTVWMPKWLMLPSVAGTVVGTWWYVKGMRWLYEKSR